MNAIIKLMRHELLKILFLVANIMIHSIIPLYMVATVFRNSVAAFEKLLASNCSDTSISAEQNSCAFDL